MKWISLRLKYQQRSESAEKAAARECLLNTLFLYLLFKLDMSAAFDTVNHQILLSTLSSLGITGIPLRWFESYLTGRSFRVAWGGEVSKAHQLVTGFLRDRFLDPSSSPYTLHHWDPSYRHMASPTIATLMTHSSISLFNQMIKR